MTIKELVKSITNEYWTNCPFKLCKHLGIVIKYFDLGEIKGFFKEIDNLKYIVINNELSGFDKRFVCAHELGHCLLHGGEDMKFLLEHKNIVRHSKYEEEANLFAAYLLKDEEINEYVKESEISFDFLNSLKEKIK